MACPTYLLFDVLTNGGSCVIMSRTRPLFCLVVAVADLPDFGSSLTLILPRSNFRIQRLTVANEALSCKLLSVSS